MPMNDGDRHAATKVDRSESFAVAPDCMAEVKCDVRMVLACAARASEGGNAMMVDTKSAIAASGCVLDHCLAPGTTALAAGSITIAATRPHTFSIPAR